MRLLVKLFQVGTSATSPDMPTVFYTWPYGRFIEIQNNLRRKKLHRTNQGSNFLVDNFSNRDNIRATTHFRREGQPQDLKRWFIHFLFRHIHFHINSTSIIILVKQNQLSFSSIKIIHPLPAPVQSVLLIRFNFKSQS